MNHRKHRSFIEAAARRALPAAILFALVMALLPQPPPLPGSPSDKLLHIVAFVALMGLAAVGYPHRLLAAALALVLYGGLIELLQAIPQLNRDSQWSDWVADSLAVLATAGIACLLRRRPPRLGETRVEETDG